MDSLPRYADHYTGELFHRVGLSGRNVVLMDLGGHRSTVPLATFERAYDAVDVVAKPGDECLELWLGTEFKGELRRTSGGYAVRIAGERFEEPYGKLAHVLEDLGLDPRTSRVLGL